MAPATTAGSRRKPPVWTREKIIDRIQRWVELYGEPPRAADWSPSSARWSGATWRIERYRQGDPDTGERWPSLNGAKAPFGGSLGAAVREAGFEPNKSGPKKRGAVAVSDVEHLATHPDVRVALDSALAQARDADAKLAVRDGQLERARNRVDRLLEELAASRREVQRARAERPEPVRRPKTKAKTKTRTRVVRERVVDTRAVQRAEKALERAEKRAADAEALARAERDQRKAATDAERRAHRRLAGLEEALATARADLADATRAVTTAEDRSTALERELTRAREPTVEVREVTVRHTDDEELEAAREAVDAARREAHAAEIRAARAERSERETVALVKGEQRKLTPAEVAELRDAGPTGPAVLAAALKDLAKARSVEGGRPALRAALSKVASAAVTWRERL